MLSNMESFKTYKTQTLECCEYYFRQNAAGVYYRYVPGDFLYLSREFPDVYQALVVNSATSYELNFYNGVKRRAWFDKYHNIIIRYSRQK